MAKSAPFYFGWGHDTSPYWKKPKVKPFNFSLQHPFNFVWNILRERFKKPINFQTLSEVLRPPPPPLRQLQTNLLCIFSTLNAVIQYKMQFYIWPTFSKRKGSIVNSRHIGNKVTYFQTTLGAGTYGCIAENWYRGYSII